MSEQKIEPFEFVKSVSETKVNLMDSPGAEKYYKPFLVNRAMSMYPDTLYLAVDMNTMPHLDHKLQYDFYLHSVRKMKRRSGKWPKEPSSEDLDLVKRYYGYSDAKAMEVLPLHSVEQLKKMKDHLSKGGVEE